MNAPVAHPAFSLSAELKLPPIVAVHNEVLPKHWAAFAERHQLQLHVVVMSDNQAGTGKLWPATRILELAIERGDHGSASRVVEFTSGGFGIGTMTAIKMGLQRSPNFPFKGMTAIVDIALPAGKRQALIDCGIDVQVVEHPLLAAMEIERLRQTGEYWASNQYRNPDNAAGYYRVAEYIARTLPNLGLIAWGVGSGGGCSGVMPVLTAAFEQRRFPLHRVAVVLADGEKVSGVRDREALESGTLPWDTNVNGIVTVGETLSYHCSAALWKQGIPCGPSTGFAAEGALQAAKRLVATGALEQHRALDGKVHILFPSVDTRTPYAEEFRRQGHLF